jgi:transposase
MGRSHVVRVCQDFHANHNINPLDWPPYSSDLFPIEHLWDEMDRRVRGRRNAPATLDQLRAALLEEWDNIYHTQRRL